MSAIAFDYNSNQIQELNAFEVDFVNGAGLGPVGWFAVGRVVGLTLGAATGVGLVIGGATVLW